MAINQGFDDSADERIQGARNGDGVRITEIGPYVTSIDPTPTAADVDEKPDWQTAMAERRAQMVVDGRIPVDRDYADATVVPSYIVKSAGTVAVRYV